MRFECVRVCACACVGVRVWVCACACVSDGKRVGMLIFKRV